MLERGILARINLENQALKITNVCVTRLPHCSYVTADAVVFTTFFHVMFPSLLYSHFQESGCI